MEAPIGCPSGPRTGAGNPSLRFLQFQVISVVEASSAARRRGFLPPTQAETFTLKGATGVSFRSLTTSATTQVAKV